MKTTLVFLLALLACQIERAALRAPEKQAASGLRYVDCSPCDLTDPDHRNAPPWGSACDMLAHAVALEKDDDVTDPAFRLVGLTDRGGFDRLVWSPSGVRREPASGLRRMLVCTTLRC